ncbi:MAG: hypothetical protein ASARMPREDX12_007399 [Alectoria sarmentosa]|nr:MAG: hypothetical protein ASARMPREDX12_007399 [Alectoria sarmentosa]
MRTAPPVAVWHKFIDPRPPNAKQSIVQLPKRISYGTCNVALFSFYSKDRKLVNSSPALAWSDIFSAGLNLDNDCLTHHEGGAIVVNDTRGKPGLSLFVWEDGAPFEWLLNHENILEFPPGMDPTNPDIGPPLLTNVTFVTGLRTANNSLLRDVSELYL